VKTEEIIRTLYGIGFQDAMRRF